MIGSAFYTHFPPIPQTIWSAQDPAWTFHQGSLEASSLLIRTGQSGMVSKGPGITLSTGLYGVEFQLASDARKGKPTDLIAQAEVTAQDREIASQDITLGQIDRQFAGMYGGVRLNLILEDHIEDVQFRVISAGHHLFHFLGCKLIPRPGLIWFPADLDHSVGHWVHQPDRSGTTTTPTILGGPFVVLDPGEYRVGVKMSAPDEVESGPLAELEVVGSPAAADKKISIVSSTTVTAESVRAHFGIPDSKLRFRIKETYCNVEIRVKALVSGVRVHWVRLATAEEATWHHYYNMGGRHSALGFPVGAFTPTGESRYGSSGYVRHFEEGSIYWTIENGPCEIFGEALRTFQQRGGLMGDLGFPTGRPRPQSPTGFIQQFEGHSLTWETTVT